MPLGLAVVIAVVLSLRGFTGNVAQPNAQGPKKNSQSRPDKAPEPNSRFDFDSAPFAEPLKQAVESAYAHDKKNSAELPALRSLIVTLPDPQATELAIFFDRTVGAVQDALAVDGYSLVSWYLPWRKESDSDDESAKDAKNLGRHSADGFVHEPGSLLFSKPSDSRRDLVFVVLVGETPTHGLDRTALSSALDFLADQRRLGGLFYFDAKPAPPTIIGPFYSGGSFGLAEELRHRTSNGNKASYFSGTNVVSGSATSDSNKGMFKDLAEFSATVPSDSKLIGALSRFLVNELGARSSDVGILYEDGTAYGQAAAENSQSHTEWPDNFRPRIFIPYPLHVSQLWAVRASEETKSRPAAPFRDALKLSYEMPKNPVDIVPLETPGATANVEDLHIERAIDVLHHEGIKYVGIIASDPRDVIYLVKQMRRSGLPAMPFTFGADVLFAHPEAESITRGMIVVSAYPQLHRDPSTNEAFQFFPDFSAQGVFNAIQSVLNSGEMKGYRSLGQGTLLPDIWITSVGRSGFAPLAREPVVDRSRYMWRPHCGSTPPYSESSRRLRVPDLARVLSLISELLVAMFLIICFCVRRSRPRGLSRLPDGIATTFVGYATSPAYGIQRACLLSIVGGLILSQAAVVALALVMLRGSSSRQTIGLLLFAAANLLLSISCLWREVNFARSTPGRSGRLLKQYGHLLVPLTICAVVGGVFTEYLILACYAGWSDGIQLPGRILELGSSVSPMMPMLTLSIVPMLSLYAGIRQAFSLELMALPDREQNETRDGKAGDSAGETRRKEDDAISLAWKRLSEALKGPGPDLVISAVVLFPLIVWAALTRARFLAIDGPAWGTLFWALFTAAMFFSFKNVLQFGMTWRALRRFLQLLSWHRLSNSFTRMPPGLAISPWRIWRLPPWLEALTCSVRQLDLLSRTVRVLPIPTNAEGMKEVADDAVRSLHEASALSALSFASSMPKQAEAVTALRKAVGLVYRLEQELLEKFPDGVLSETPESPARIAETAKIDTVVLIENGDLKISPYTWFRLADEFIAVRVVALIHGVFSIMRVLLLSALIMFMLILLAMNSYPFQPKLVATGFIWCMSAAAFGIVIQAFIQMERDVILSHIGKTDPGEVNFTGEFINTLAVYILVPLLSLIAAQFPAIGDFLYSLVSPAFRTLH